MFVGFWGGGRRGFFGVLGVCWFVWSLFFPWVGVVTWGGVILVGLKYVCSVPECRSLRFLLNPTGSGVWGVVVTRGIRYFRDMSCVLVVLKVVKDVWRHILPIMRFILRVLFSGGTPDSLKCILESVGMRPSAPASGWWDSVL